MIQLIRSEQFHKDLAEVLDWLYSRAVKDGKDPDSLEKNFKDDFLKTIGHLQSNPFMYSAYSSNNPTRRAVFFFGNYIIEYQLVPIQSRFGEEVEEVILASLIPARSERFDGAYEDLDVFELNEEE
ncbi:hypothetical protein DOM21_07130 [Bacteriovorax stolpii]|uniref:hypothetical protein n=1 Tax=Bacteriovorax stolpii TaxID=960 RepID=UPI00115A165D|nr:hypothetical protein [Bacteriovorax stolpii]QDK41232.1 hypothetical protein DOM21_07130 [Bacteriovorax stolpii]